MSGAGQGLAIEWVKFARANTVSPGYIATELSNFIPPETHEIWKRKTPVSFPITSLPGFMPLTDVTDGP